LKKKKKQAEGDSKYTKKNQSAILDGIRSLVVPYYTKN
jgi:hypothetical protein